MTQLTIPEVGPDPALPEFEVVLIGSPDDVPDWLPYRCRLELEDAEAEHWRGFSRYRDDTTFLAVKIGDDIQVHGDGVTSEDCSFYDGWSWVAPALRAAYELGRSSVSEPATTPELAGSDKVI